MLCQLSYEPLVRDSVLLDLPATEKASARLPISFGMSTRPGYLSTARIPALAGSSPIRSWRRPDSNRRRTAYETVLEPTSSPLRIVWFKGITYLVRREGLEPPMYLTSRVYSALASPDLHTDAWGE